MALGVQPTDLNKLLKNYTVPSSLTTPTSMPTPTAKNSPATMNNPFVNPASIAGGGSNLNLWSSFKAPGAPVSLIGAGTPTQNQSLGGAGDGAPSYGKDPRATGSTVTDATPAVNKDPRSTADTGTTATPAVNKDPRTVDTSISSTAPAPIVTMDKTTPPADQITYTPNPIVTMDTAPKSTGVTSNIPMPMGAETTTPTYANPWDDPNYQEPKPPDASVYAGQGAAMTEADKQGEKDKAIQAKNGQSQAGAMATADQNKAEPTTIEPPPTTIDDKVAANDTPIQDSLTEFADLAKKMMNPTEDPVFRVAANHVMQQMGLMNTAERDALQMRINSDPSLKGMGAGQAMLAMMTRDQNFKADDVFAQLSSDSQQRLIDMQKYGLQEGIAIEGVRRARTQEDIKNLVASGNFVDAAKLTQQSFAKDGLTGITIDPKSLQSRDSFSIDQFKSRMDTIKELAMTDPTAATNMLRLEMNNPAQADWFPKGATPEQFIQTLMSTGTSDAIDRATKIEKELNTIASNTSSSYVKAESYIKQLFQEQRRDPIKEGHALTLQQINDVRTKEGLGAWTQAEDGSIRDEVGNPITESDYADMAYRNEFQDRKDNANKKPWDVAYDLISSSPDAAKYLGVDASGKEAYPGAKDALKSYLASYFTDPGSYTTDPETGLPVPKMDSVQLPWNNPKMYQMFYTWPLAHFDENGRITTDAKGQAIFDRGGDVYGETVNGEVVKSTPDDEAMDQKWLQYTRTGGSLTAPEWYFASAGGTQSNLDEARIPDAIKVKKASIDGAPGDTPPPGPGENNSNPESKVVPLPADPNPADRMKTTNSILDAYASTVAPDVVAKLKTDTVAFRDIANKLSPSKIGGVPDSKQNNLLLEAAINRLKQHGVPDSIIQKNFNKDGAGGTFLEIGQYHDVYDTNQIGMGYAIYANMVDKGYTPQTAFKALSALIGDDRARAAVSLDGQDTATLNG